MSDLAKAKTDPKELLWEQLGKVHAGMLGLEGSRDHLQPMAHNCDEAAGRLWFLTRRDSEFAGSLRPGAVAHFVIISSAQDFHACMAGPIAEEKNGEVLDKIWNSVSGAWFDGKDDPQLVMLALDLERASIWASTANTLAFAWEIAKANVTDGGRPDVGVQTEVEFA